MDAPAPALPTTTGAALVANVSQAPSHRFAATAPGSPTKPLLATVAPATELTAAVAKVAKHSHN